MGFESKIVNAKGLEDVTKQIKSVGGSTPLQVVAYVTKDAKRIVDETIKQFGKFDVLLNNAGNSNHDKIQDLKMEDFDRVFNTNVRSVVILTQLCVPHLEENEGKYCEYFQHRRIETNFHTNCIHPAVIRTPIFGNVGMNEETANKLFEQVKKAYPVGRVGEVSNTSEAIAFLADNEGTSFLTGIFLSVDGGSMVAGRRRMLKIIMVSAFTIHSLSLPPSLPHTIL
ncbi:3-oxoacyl-[acyl-carrier-protein] reductase FabG-like [Sitodiplosis mosellana]|uniref:3-oxoacyl-[acyl-carrier-protein] reductase FabG-like n=1 Tax=Sitodiplosis mosellana TaxID=263140 RepID=UPI0024452BB5|nr:3-oxoacyl-[acyl-carrier-protein] reductase FabG-like [Sitodiplosis mosellana]